MISKNKILLILVSLLLFWAFSYLLNKNYSKAEIIWKVNLQNLVKEDFKNPEKVIGGLINNFYIIDNKVFLGTTARPYELSDDSRNYVYTLDAKTGIFKWKYKFKDEQEQMDFPVISNGIVHFLHNKFYGGNNYGWELTSLDKETGKEVEEKGVSIEEIKQTNEKVSKEYYTKEFNSKVIAKWNDVAAFGKRSPTVEVGNLQFYVERDNDRKFYWYAIDKNTGKVLWKKESGALYYPPIISNGTLYYERQHINFPGTSSWYSLHAINLNDGSTKWDWNRDAKLSMHEINGVIYFRSVDCEAIFFRCNYYLYAVK